MCSRVCHWGPIGAISIVLWVTLATVYCNTMWWPPQNSWGGFANMMGFMMLSCLTSFHYVGAMFEGPGYLSREWKPEIEDDEDFLQYCEACQGFKAPRAHHCRKCGHCVMKMDHHCPWINNCVGHRNHGHFVAFLFFAVIGCAVATWTLAMSLYYGLNRSWYYHYGNGSEPKIYLSIYTLFIILFGLGLAIGVVLAVGALLFFQLRSIWRNQTGIEDWIMEKAAYRLKNSDKQFENPYQKDGWSNLRMVLSAGCRPLGNGIDYPLRDGSGKYDMTIEQIEQKQAKRHRTREYEIMSTYSGSWLPIWSMGCRVGCSPPCTDEPRIMVEKGDKVRVTRWKKHWLYGDKHVLQTPSSSSADKPAERQRGWFPRKCAVDVIDNSKRWQQQQHAKSCELHEDQEETTAERVLRNREKIAASGKAATKKGEEKKNI